MSTSRREAHHALREAQPWRVVLRLDSARLGRASDVPPLCGPDSEQGEGGGEGGDEACEGVGGEEVGEGRVGVGEGEGGVVEGGWGVGGGGSGGVGGVSSGCCDAVCILCLGWECSRVRVRVRRCQRWLLILIGIRIRIRIHICTCTRTAAATAARTYSEHTDVPHTRRESPQRDGRITRKDGDEADEGLHAAAAAAAGARCEEESRETRVCGGGVVCDVEVEGGGTGGGGEGGGEAGEVEGAFVEDAGVEVVFGLEERLWHLDGDVDDERGAVGLADGEGVGPAADDGE
ncbi:hypothetical protein K439DRAFT_1624878, partial [Ramaria rubella]